MAATGSAAMLEQKYIQLLERRVADLEARLTSGGSTDDKRAKSDTPTTSEVTVATSATTETSSENEGEAKKDSVAKNKDEKKDEKTGDDKVSPEDERYKVVLNSLDPETGEYVDKTPAAAKKKKDTKKSNRAFTFRKMMRTQTIRGEEVLKAASSEVEVESEPLQKLLAKVTGKYAGLNKINLLESPFENLIWSWDRAIMESTENPDDTEEMEQARQDLKALLDLISKSSGDEALDRYLRNKDTMRENRTITFESLWTLFPKGSLVLARPFLEEPQVFMVQGHINPDFGDLDGKFQLIAYSYDWNGSTFNRVPYAFEIPSFNDKKGIFQLPCYPLSEYRDKVTDGDASNSTDVDNLKAKLIERGERFVEYCIAEKGKQTFRYNGMAFSQQGGGLFRSDSYDDDDESFYSRSYGRGDESVGVKDTASHLDGVVVIDFKSYLQYQTANTALLGDLHRYMGLTECGCNECRQSFQEVYKSAWDKQTKDKKLSEEQLLMLPPRVLGYALAQKRWVQLRVSRVRKPGSADARNFDDKLIMNGENKKLIKNAVKAHGKENITDYIPNKGKGLVILLWGVPGVGKTLTAESVASLAGKPLFSIGVSDIGTQSTRVEANLQKIFNLAGQWEAVLLFDEADVFLEARDSRGSDMHRNTMVSVLLRILEYYEGILILTTNRLKTFDIAVQSRIHIAIEYSDLTKDQRMKIFEEFLNQLHEQGNLPDKKGCMDWVDEEGQNKPFNGRQIRNIVSTAMGMAHAEGSTLNRKHLVKVAQNTETFKKALLEQEAIYKNTQIKAHYGA